MTYAAFVAELGSVEDLDGHVDLVKAWSPKARQAALEARRRGGGGRPAGLGLRRKKPTRNSKGQRYNKETGRWERESAGEHVRRGARRNFNEKRRKALQRTGKVASTVAFVGAAGVGYKLLTDPKSRAGVKDTVRHPSTAPIRARAFGEAAAGAAKSGTVSRNVAAGTKHAKDLADSGAFPTHAYTQGAIIGAHGVVNDVSTRYNQKLKTGRLRRDLRRASR